MSSWGGIFFIAGTSIGAGTLALPMISCSVGFVKSFIVMIAMSLVMIATGFLNIRLIKQYNTSIPVLSKIAFGKFGSFVSMSAFLTLHYALLAAYMTGAAEILSFILPFRLGLVLYLGICGLFLTSKYFDHANRFVFAIKVFVFAGIIALLFPKIKTEHLFFHNEHSQILPLIPVFFTSYAFHGSLFSLMRLTKGDLKKIKTSIIGGVIITVLFYGLWQMCALGVLRSPDNHSDVSDFLSAVCASAGGKTLLAITPIFSFLAITTSFFGVGVGLFDYMKEVTKRDKKILNAGLTFLPPLAFAFFYPDGFIKALEFAAIALSILVVFLPCMIARFYTKKINIFYFIFFILFSLGIVLIKTIT
jgi:tyrosine-specific transport protein